jgi:hypothetical protein
MSKYKINISNYLHIIIFTLVLLITIKQTNFFKNIYFVFKLNYEERLMKQYEFCGYESLGFLNYIKKKYNINKRIPVINFGNSPNPEWFYSDLKINELEKRIIFLSYGRNEERFLDLYKKYNLQDFKIIEKVESCYFVVKK